MNKVIARYTMQNTFEIFTGNKKFIGINKNIIFIILKFFFSNKLKFTKKF